MDFSPLSQTEEIVDRAIVHAAFAVHSQLGPGLLEKIYEACMAYELTKQGFLVKRQVNLPIYYDNQLLDEGLRLDLLVEDIVITEFKAVETIHPVYETQILSHLKLSGLKLGYLINFNVPLIKQGIKRFRV